jgi:hypothetical protein
MPTFLTTSKMNAALAARVEASVTGRAGADPNARARSVRRITAIARVVLTVGITWGMWAGFGAWRQSRIDLENARARLLDKTRAASANLGAKGDQAIARVEARLVPLTGPWTGDLVDDSLRAEGLPEILGSRPVLYVRGSLDALSKRSAIPEAAASSSKDALLFCLVDPPRSRTEPVLLDKVRVAYGSASIVETETPNVRRLGELLAGMPFLLPAWVDAILAAPDRDTLARMNREFDRAPIAHAKEAARSSLLLVAMDEPGTGNGPTELDGERPHPIRLFLVDLDTDKVMLRVKKSVDPSWIPIAKRPHYSRGLDDCAFAFDVGEDVKKK